MDSGLRVLLVAGCMVTAAVADQWSSCSVAWTPEQNKTKLMIFSTSYNRANIYMCEGMRDYQKKYEKVSLAGFNDHSLNGVMDNFGRELNEDRFLRFEDLLARKSSEYDVFYLDTQWVAPLEDSLQPLPHAVLEDYDKKWIHTSTRTGLPLTVPDIASQLVYYYRKDIFDEHGYTWPDQSWDQFTTVLTDIQEKERVRRNNPNYTILCMSSATSANAISYSLATLLSGEGAGSVVEDDGTVSFDNPGAVRAVQRWKDWFGTIMGRDTIGFGSSDIVNRFKDDKAAVILVWTTKAKALNEHVKSSAAYKNWVVEAAPVPGPKGAGCSGDWGLAISKYSTHQEEAMGYIEMYSKFQYNVTLHEYDQLPKTGKLVNNTDLYGEYCQKNPIICESFAKYPAFWKRSTHRPSRGCKSLYRKCADVVYTQVYPFILSEGPATQTAEEVVRTTAINLKVVLGSLLDSVLLEEESNWTTERIIMIAICGVGGVALIAMGIHIRRRATAMEAEKVKRATIPISVMFGTIVAVCTGITVGVAIALQDATTRDVSWDLAEQVRAQTLYSIDSVLTTTVDSLRESPDLSMAAIRQTAVAKAKNDIGRMGTMIHPSSLVMLIDIDNDGYVLISTNNRRQKERASSADHSEWTKAAMKAHASGASGVGHSETVDLSSQSVALNTKTIRITGEIGFQRAEWLVVYMQPVSVIQGEADRAVRRTLQISVCLAVPMLVLAVLLAASVTTPLMTLATDMKSVKSMKMDKVKHQQSSRLTETSALIAQFHNMCRMLKEYRSFLPNSIFDTDMHHAVTGRGPPDSPEGTAIVFTDIEGSTTIWEACSAGMKTALRIHNSIIRQSIDDCNGYEVKTIGDAFMIAFDTVVQACNFALMVQERLYLSKEWSDDLLDIPACQADGPWNGLNVRIGIHKGEVELEDSPLTGRADYFGPTVNKAARIESVCPGGAVAISEELVTEEVQASLNNPVVLKVGGIPLKGITDFQSICFLLPVGLKRRAHSCVSHFNKMKEKMEKDLGARRSIPGANPLDKNSSKNKHGDEIFQFGCAPGVADDSSRTQALPAPMEAEDVDELVSTQIPTGLREKLHKTPSATIAHVNVCFKHLSNSEDPLTAVSEVLHTCVAAMERWNGTVMNICSSSLVAVWNTTKKCPSHVSQSLRFCGTLLDRLKGSPDAWEEKVTVGLATGTLLYGNVSASDQRFAIIVGAAVETGQSLSQAASANGVFMLMASLPGHPSAFVDPQYQQLIRPVDKWLFNERHPMLVYQVRVEQLSPNHGWPSHLMIGERASSISYEWGWSPAYHAAFSRRDIDAINEHVAEDPILAKVAANLAQGAQTNASGYESLPNLS